MKPLDKTDWRLVAALYLAACIIAGTLIGYARGATIARTVPAGTTIVVTHNGVDETLATVTTEPVTLTLTPAATTQPVTPPTPAPLIPGTRIPSGGKVPNSGTVLLDYGGVYTATLTPASNTSYLAVGDSSKPKPIINGSLTTSGTSNVTVNGIAFHGNGKPGIVGVNVFRIVNFKLLNCSVTGYGSNGVNIQGYGGVRCKGATVQGCLIADNWPADGSKHCEGLYAQETDGLVIDGNVFSSNGGAPGVGTQYNQGAYIHATNGPAVVTNNVFHRNAAHGLQQRSGGTNHGNVFIDNPVGMSYGLVNGEACYAGGVSGTVEDNVYIGGGAVAGGPNAGKRGWALELSNAKNVVVQRLIVAHDNQNASKAIHVANCQGLTNPAQMLSPDKWGLSLKDCWVYDWPPGPIEVTAGKPVLVNVGNKPPKQPNLRDALGAGFMTWARANPGTAASTAVAKCKAAAGVN